MGFNAVVSGTYLNLPMKMQPTNRATKERVVLTCVKSHLKDEQEHNKRGNITSENLPSNHPGVLGKEGLKK